MHDHNELNSSRSGRQLEGSPDFHLAVTASFAAVITNIYSSVVLSTIHNGRDRDGYPRDTGGTAIFHCREPPTIA